MNMSSVNQWRARCVSKQRRIVSTFRCAASRLIGTNRFGEDRSPSYFGTSYSRIRWLRNVFQVSSQTKRWSWWLSARRWVRIKLGSIWDFSRSKSFRIGSPSCTKYMSRKSSTITRNEATEPANSSALARASSARSSVALRTTQTTSRSG